ncbi:hypothetical protein PCE12_004031 [Salmonella enterica]|nr:hypothetical protein [Salmonella enterica]EHW1828832.1 hypothetical protein [Salmonella enterica subsp. arizonae serovar 40:z36:-]HCM1880194.1 hypothetical protein [Salmonella enterica subsp. arizonae serovar 63:z4,z23:-]ECE4237960.1 hypothetical protein [Salmonella enterica]EJW1315155.1 hypothetical protein [Salmonella enterica]
MSQPENGPFIPAIRWPVPNNRGGEFSNLEEMLAHLEGEAAGHWLIGRNGMWHGGIHISGTTTPWCALSGQAMNEAVDFPVPFKGEQAVRCMADGEVVAYRINRDYLSVPWYRGDLHYSGSFVLVRHRIQPGKTAESGLTFYTLYMHLAPWLAYPEKDSTAFKVADGQHLKAYVDTSRQWVAAELPPSRETLQFDTVVCPTPYPIKAGDPVGHLGYFQVPSEDGHEKRYQVHIECLTADDLPRFLSNPEGVGRDTPAFARCPKDIPVYLQFSSGEIQKGLITTQTETVMALSRQPYSKAEAFNYRQLLDKIDDGKSTWYNAEQYRRAVQNPSMRDHLNSLCVKHPSDWYYSSETPVWKAFFTPQLKKEAPEWYAYSEKFLIDLRWMHRVPGMMENPWHMHPLVFLDAITMNAKVWVLGTTSEHYESGGR